MTFRGPADHTSSYHSYTICTYTTPSERKEEEEEEEKRCAAELTLRSVPFCDGGGILIDGIWNWKRKTGCALFPYWCCSFHSLTTIAKKWRGPHQQRWLAPTDCVHYSLFALSLSLSLSLNIHSPFRDARLAYAVGMMMMIRTSHPFNGKRLDEMQPCSTWLSTIHPPSSRGWLRWWIETQAQRKWLE